MDPTSTSTPNKTGPKKRQGIHDQVISPLSNAALQGAEEELTTDDEDEVDRDDEMISADESTESDEPEHEEEVFSHKVKEDVRQAPRGEALGGVFIALIVASLLGWLFLTNGDDNNITAGPTISDLKTQFPLQSKEFWLHIQSGISDVNLLNKPSVYIFLYEEGNEITLEKLLKNVSVYANCLVNNNCDVEPLVLKGERLNTPQLIRDYGQLIERYEPQLRQKHVMIIRNLDKMHSNVAQALHSFCDEYTPLVSNSLFLFTVRVDKFEGEPLHQVLAVLRNKWKDLETDKLEPLLTRISNMVLRITAETTTTV